MKIYILFKVYSDFDKWNLEYFTREVFENVSNDKAKLKKLIPKYASVLLKSDYIDHEKLSDTKQHYVIREYKV